jgi:hypothetical protein
VVYIIAVWNADGRHPAARRSALTSQIFSVASILDDAEVLAVVDDFFVGRDAVVGSEQLDPRVACR